MTHRTGPKLSHTVTQATHTTLRRVPNTCSVMQIDEDERLQGQMNTFSQSRAPLLGTFVRGNRKPTSSLAANISLAHFRLALGS